MAVAATAIAIEVLLALSRTSVSSTVAETLPSNKAGIEHKLVHVDPDTVTHFCVMGTYVARFEHEGEVITATLDKNHCHPRVEMEFRF